MEIQGGKGLGKPMTTLPFWLAMFVCLMILLAFPQLALFLPQTMLK